jgi:HAD superfamily hydrolase (TIGR01450 family)
VAGDDAAAGPDSLFQGYVFDLDGTVYLGDELLPGAARLLARLRELDRRVAFVSNNPTRDPQMYVDKLRRLGVQASVPEVLNTVVTMTRWLTRNHPDATVFPIAEEPLWRALSEAGIRLSDDPAEIDIVVASYDRGFDYRKLQIAFDAIWFHRRARLVTTNPDRYCPFPGGRGEPDAGAIVAAIEACTGAICEVNVGKPDPLMLEAAMELLGLEAGDCVMVGDRLYTDIRMARAAGMASALVMTGDTTRATLDAAPPEDRPTWVLERVDRLLPPSALAPGEPRGGRLPP